MGFGIAVWGLIGIYGVGGLGKCFRIVSLGSPKFGGPGLRTPVRGSGFQDTSMPCIPQTPKPSNPQTLHRQTLYPKT